MPGQMNIFDLLASVGDPISSADLLVSIYVISVAVDFSHLRAREVVRMSSEELDFMSRTKIWLVPTTTTTTPRCAES